MNMPEGEGSSLEGIKMIDLREKLGAFCVGIAGLRQQHKAYRDQASKISCYSTVYVAYTDSAPDPDAFRSHAVVQA